MQYYIWWIQNVTGDSYPPWFSAIFDSTQLLQKSKKERFVGENARPSSKENSSECGEERKTKLWNNRFAKRKNGNIWRRMWNRWKKTKVRKRHIVVDVLGYLLFVNVHVANVHDTKSEIVVAKLSF